MTGKFTGRHMTAFLVAFFAVVVGVNFAMARYATSTFGGVVVENSYVASQHFNRWLDEASSEQALGWRAKASRSGGGRVSVSLGGPVADNAVVTAVARHPLGRQPDQPIAFDSLGSGRYVSRAALPPGRWRLRLEVVSQGRTMRAEQDVF